MLNEIFQRNIIKNTFMANECIDKIVLSNDIKFLRQLSTT